MVAAKTKFIWPFSFALIGLSLSIYAFLHHLEVKEKGFTNAVCNVNNFINCDHVAASEYSEFLGIPLASWGISYFICTAFCLLLLLSKKYRLLAETSYMIFAIVGAAVSIVLAMISLVWLKTLCAICIGVYAITFLQAFLVWRDRNSLRQALNRARILTAIFASASLVTVSLGSCKVFEEAQEDSLEDIPVAEPSFAPESHRISLSKTEYSDKGEDYRLGGDNAKAIIVTFEDFECPACQRMSDYLKGLHKDFGDEVLIVFRNYPLNSDCNSDVNTKMHAAACDLAIMARCAGQYGKFWQYSDQVFANQRDATPAKAKSWAGAVGLSEAQIAACVKDKAILEKIAADVAEAAILKIRGTPTVFVNGERFVGNDINAIGQKVEEIIKGR